MKRIQRKRTKGWRMPANTVYVGRPSKWGNPYAIRGPYATNSVRTKEEAIQEYEIWLRERLTFQSDFLDELQGKDLACWCPLDKPCHADVLLKLLDERVKV